MELDLATAASTFDEEASKAFVAEFIKYRFGAFEEHGHDGSDVYPLFYRKLEEVSRTQQNQHYDWIVGHTFNLGNNSV